MSAVAATKQIFSMEHKDGVMWWDAPLPKEKHDCWRQTSAFTSDGMIYRCACGATCFDRDWRLGNEGWVWRNERRYPAGSPRPKPRRWWQRAAA